MTSKITKGLDGLIYGSILNEMKIIVAKSGPMTSRCRARSWVEMILVTMSE